MFERLGIGKNVLGCGLAVILFGAVGLYKSKHDAQAELHETDATAEAKNRRNAQNIASVYASASAAASDFPKLQTKEDVIETMRTGVMSYGFTETRFAVPNISDRDAEALAPYLSFDPKSGELSYVSKPVATNISVDSIHESIRPHMGGREEIKHRRNAKIIVSVYASAQEAGARFESNDLSGICKRLHEGVIGTGRESTTTFRVPPMSAGEIAGAQEFLAFDSEKRMIRFQSRP